MGDPERCAFCQIVSGGEASAVWDDDFTLAFMNIRQANPGHVLVIPKRHLECIFDLDDYTAAHLARTVVRVSGQEAGLPAWG